MNKVIKIRNIADLVKFVCKEYQECRDGILPSKFDPEGIEPMDKKTAIRCVQYTVSDLYAGLAVVDIQDIKLAVRQLQRSLNSLKD